MRHRRDAEARVPRVPTSYRAAATALLVLGLLCVLIEVQSASLIYWTGERVMGENDGGIVYYHVDGEQRTLNAHGLGPPTPTPTAVYADPADSSRDRIAGPARWLDAAFVLAPFLAAGVVLAAGFGRRGRLRRRDAERESRRRAEATSGGVRPDRGAAPPPSRSTRWRRSSR